MLIPVNTFGIKSGKFVEKFIPENGHFINSCSYVIANIIIILTREMKNIFNCHVHIHVTIIDDDES